MLARKGRTSYCGVIKMLSLLSCYAALVHIKTRIVAVIIYL